MVGHQLVVDNQYYDPSIVNYQMNWWMAINSKLTTSKYWYEWSDQQLTNANN